MPDRIGRVYATHRFRVSRVVEAPLRYVYDWCADFRADDDRLSRSRPRPRYRIVSLTRDRLVRIRLSGRRNPGVAVDLIRLLPPYGWHTDQIDREDLGATDYRLTALGAQRTRVAVSTVERWMTGRHPTHPAYRRRILEAWDRYARAIELRYRSGRPAKG
jgi:hypothetical protein